MGTRLKKCMATRTQSKLATVECSYPRCVGGHGYCSRLVCLFVICESAHLDTIALRLQPSHNKLLVSLVVE